MVSDWQFKGLGIAVRDIKKTVEYYESLEIAEFQPEVILDSGLLEDVELSTESAEASVTARTRIGHIGSVDFEFVQPLEGEAIYRESLDSRGEGICDMTFTVGNLEDETAKLAERGVPVVLSGKPENGPPFVYFDTRESSGNVMVRLIQRA